MKNVCPSLISNDPYCIHELPDGDITSSIWISPGDMRNSDATYSRLSLSLVQLFCKFPGKDKEHLEVLASMGFSFNEPNEYTDISL